MVAMHQGTGIGGSIIKPGSDRPMYLGNPAALEVVQSQRRNSAVERYWMVFEADVVLQRDALHVFWLLQHRDRGP